MRGVGHKLPISCCPYLGMGIFVHVAHVIFCPLLFLSVRIKISQVWWCNLFASCGDARKLWNSWKLKTRFYWEEYGLIDPEKKERMLVFRQKVKSGEPVRSLHTRRLLQWSPLSSNRMRPIRDARNPLFNRQIVSESFFLFVFVSFFAFSGIGRPSFCAFILLQVDCHSSFLAVGNKTFILCREENYFDGILGKYRG